VLVYLSTVATAILFFLYTIAMRWVPAYEAALFGALVPVFGSIIAFFLLGEKFVKSGFMGAAMVLSGMILVVSRPSVDQDSSELSTGADSELKLVKQESQ
jgi:drug/metabolite transporter (DMT)-like permease